MMSFSTNSMSLPPQSHSRRSRLAVLPALALLTASSFSACSRASSNTLAVENAEGERLSKTVFTEKLGVHLVYSPLKAGKPSDFALRLTRRETRRQSRGHAQRAFSEHCSSAAISRKTPKHATQRYAFPGPSVLIIGPSHSKGPKIKEPDFTFVVAITLAPGNGACVIQMVGARVIGA
jgi:hypothetical protein